MDQQELMPRIIAALRDPFEEMWKDRVFRRIFVKAWPLDCLERIAKQGSLIAPRKFVWDSILRYKINRECLPESKRKRLWYENFEEEFNDKMVRIFLL